MAKKAKSKGGAAEAGGEKPNSRKKLFMMGGGVAVLLAAGGGYFMLGGSDAAEAGDEPVAAAAHEAADAHGAAEGEAAAAGHGAAAVAEEPTTVAGPGEVYYYRLPEIVVNLATLDQRAAFIRVQAVLELADRNIGRTLDNALPRVLDTVQTYLRELRTTDLQGSAGMFRLKEELRERINLAIYPAVIREVLFENVLVQ